MDSDKYTNAHTPQLCSLLSATANSAPQFNALFPPLAQELDLGSGHDSRIPYGENYP